jgi:DNA-binding NtrC family response regulator
MRVIYMSGYSHEVLAPQALTQNDISAFIEKPFSAQALRATVRELLDRPGDAEGDEVGG